MKKNYFVYVFAMLIMILGLSACSNHTRPYGSIDVDPRVAPITRNRYAVALPANYSQKNYKRLIVAVYFDTNKKMHNDAGLPLATVATSLETEIAKLKRFTIVSRQGGQKAILAEQRFQASGRTNEASRLRFDSGLNANYVLYCEVSGVREEYERVDHNELIYIVRLDYQLIDAETGEIVEADYTEGRARRTCVCLPSGRIIAGFDYRRGEIDPVNQAALNGLKLLGMRLGTTLPLGGQVVAVRGDRIKIDKGIAEGFASKQIVTVYTEDLGPKGGFGLGMDVPIAVAELTPSDHNSIGTIFAWNEEPYAQEIVAAFRNDPNFIMRQNVYVVSQGMPLPPEWDRNYKD